MNWAHAHLVLNHISVLGIAVGFFWKQKDERIEKITKQTPWHSALLKISSTLS
jgi:hypothetical protein